MATDSFKFWDAYYDALKFLDSDERRGRFMMGLCGYVFNGVEPDFDDQILEFGFRLIKTQARESMELAHKARKGGLKSGQTRKAKGVRKGVPNPLPNEEKGREEKGNESSLPSTDNDQPAPPPAP